MGSSEVTRVMAAAVVGVCTRKPYIPSRLDAGDSIELIC